MTFLTAEQVEVFLVNYFGGPARPCRRFRLSPAQTHLCRCGWSGPAHDVLRLADDVVHHISELANVRQERDEALRAFGVARDVAAAFEQRLNDLDDEDEEGQVLTVVDASSAIDAMSGLHESLGPVGTMIDKAARSAAGELERLSTMIDTASSSGHLPVRLRATAAEVLERNGGNPNSTTDQMLEAAQKIERLTQERDDAARELLAECDHAAQWEATSDSLLVRAEQAEARLTELRTVIAQVQAHAVDIRELCAEDQP